MSKNIFVFAALFFVVPFLSYGNTEEQIVAPKHLKHFIENADEKGFKSAYNLFIKSGVQNRAALNQSLANTAQEVRNKLQQKFEAMDDSNINKMVLAKGLAQTISGLWGLSGVALMYWITYKAVGVSRTEHEKYIKKLVSYKMMQASFLVAAGVQVVSNIGMRLTRDPNDIRGACGLGQTSWWDLTPFIPFGFPGLAFGAITCGSGIGVAHGLRNVKAGLDYKAYLEQQIKKIDQINAFIIE